MLDAHKLDRWNLARNVTIQAAVETAKPEDAFQDAVKQARLAYLRLTDVETVRLHDLAREGTPEQQAFARETLSRNAYPLLVLCARDFAWRCGGWLEALDCALHLLNLVLPRNETQDSGRVKKTGWNPHLNGLKWLFWVEKTLAAEMPKQAERFVDEKKASGAAAAIAAARSRLLGTYGNDVLLQDGLFVFAGGAWKGKTTRALPRGRKNVTPKRGRGRYTASFVASRRVVKAVYPRLEVKTIRPGGHVAVTHAHAALPLVTHITAGLVARTVRANARLILARPGLTERTRAQAEALSRVTVLWVERNSRSQKLDAVVGEDGDERLQDIIAAPEKEERRFEAPLHQADRARALHAYRRYGPQHGPVLLALPVRQLLPVYRQRQRDAQVRDLFRRRCAHWGVEATQEVVACAREALALTGTSPDAGAQELRLALAPVQAALNGGMNEARLSPLGSALAGALQGQRLAPCVTNEEGIRVARVLRKKYPRVAAKISLVASVLLGRKLDKTGKADRVYVAACVKAGVRVKQADDALALLANVPVTTRKGERVRVHGGTRYVRPYQLELERQALSVGTRADSARVTLLDLEGRLARLDEDLERGDGAAWLDLLDARAGLARKVEVARRVSDTLTGAAEALEEAAVHLTLGPALAAMLDVDAVMSDHLALQNAELWFADAHWALDERHKARWPLLRRQIYTAWAPVARHVLFAHVKALPDVAVPF